MIFYSFFYQLSYMIYRVLEMSLIFVTFILYLSLGHQELKDNQCVKNLSTYFVTFSLY